MVTERTIDSANVQVDSMIASRLCIGPSLRKTITQTREYMEKIDTIERASQPKNELTTLQIKNKKIRTAGQLSIILWSVTLAFLLLTMAATAAQISMIEPTVALNNSNLPVTLSKLIIDSIRTLAMAAAIVFTMRYIIALKPDSEE